MQTTLLGLAMALILALIAALVGPYFIDWNQFRTQFEAEATRLVGAPVRVSGALDARLLPTPSLQLRSVTVGGANDPGRLRADKLDVEFSLGDLMRGQWRADRLTLNGFALDLGLDAKGRLDWPASGLSNLAGLTVDRLDLTGRIALHDAASRATLELNDIAFSGELRALLGSLRGDGNFLMAGTRYPFRLSLGRVADGNGTRLHLTVDPGARALSADLDGVLSFAARSPRFDGAVTLAAPAPAAGKDAPKAADAPTPWRVSARVKADADAARLAQLEASYGPEDRALKLSGAGELQFGAQPHLQATLAARQLDADRLLADGGVVAPAHWLRQLRGLAQALPSPPLPSRIEISADQIMLGGRPVQNIAADLRSDSQAWMLERLSLRAPGGSELALRGAASDANDSFKGQLSVDSADPDLLAAWLQARDDTPGRVPRPLRARAAVSVAPDGVVIDALKAELDGGTLQGRIALSGAAGASRIEAALQADRIDLDGAASLLRSLAGPQPDWPDEAKLSFDFARATARGQVMQPLVARLNYGQRMLALEQLKIGTAGGAMLDGDGSFDRSDATGHLQVSARAPALGQIAGAIAPLAPAVAARLQAMGDARGAAHATLSLTVAPSNNPASAKGKNNKAKAGQAEARAALTIDAPQLKGRVSLTARPSLAELRGADVEALLRSEVTAETDLSATRGEALLALLRLDRAIAAGEGGARLQASATGAWQAPLRLKAHLTGEALDVEAEGSAKPWASEPTATLNLKAPRLNLTPLLRLDAADPKLATISLTSRLGVAGSKWSFNDIDAGIAGAKLRGRIAVTLGDDKDGKDNANVIEGEAGIDTLQLAPLFRLAVGAGVDQTAPLGNGWMQGWRGRVTFQALRGVLPGGAELQPVSGVIRGDGRSLSVDSKGKIGGGEAEVDVHAQPSDAGVALNLRLQLAGVDGAALHYRALAMPAARVALQMTLDSSGRSASALAGALSGGGSVTLQSAQIPGLDPKAFAVAIHAGEAGGPIDADNLERLIAPVLAAGTLPVAETQFPLSLANGQLRVTATTLDSPAARAVVSGGYDIPADQVDIRASLTPKSTAAALRPDITIFVTGPPDALTRSVDVAALSSWLAVQRIDRETKKLELLERDAARSAPLPGAIAPKAVAPSKPSPAKQNPPAAPSAATPAPAQPSAVERPAESSIPTPAQPSSPTPDAAGAGAPNLPLNVPVPGRDPRDATSRQGTSTDGASTDGAAQEPSPKPEVERPRRTATPQPSRPAAREKAAPLPPPIEIRPAPGDGHQPRRRAPLVITPNPPRAPF
ncbi:MULTISPECIES: AsmA family protein [Rhodopseudomonas]|uniref:AsmA domain-containing protein n=1 Tax=Rhodopseudomonas palustris TaxID=1076 RepID=A0A0D7F3Q9_RHOPL|nr:MULTISPECIES: AsmA family protein [Rhodopseudomonas]KIZ47435.1 hypothetical protein OO17_04345 [Rhodopseudomonas palustris]MDF3808947.1 AsmA-like C-terminal region-containing protein [Rhodopseudomonas sp. BAL398]WOK18344.1 AsmA-like C-terminal region-containing protein [Rhodopseudomonas sp. BAL398]